MRTDINNMVGISSDPSQTGNLSKTYETKQGAQVVYLDNRGSAEVTLVVRGLTFKIQPETEFFKRFEIFTSLEVTATGALYDLIVDGDHQ
jgi:hypothetical protein